MKISNTYFLLDTKLGVELRVKLRGIAEDEAGRGRKYSSASLMKQTTINIIGLLVFIT